MTTVVWKKRVFYSPSRSHVTRDFCHQNISSCSIIIFSSQRNCPSSSVNCLDGSRCIFLWIPDNLAKHWNFRSKMFPKIALFHYSNNFLKKLNFGNNSSRPSLVQHWVKNPSNLGSKNHALGSEKKFVISVLSEPPCHEPKEDDNLNDSETTSQDRFSRIEPTPAF